MPWTTATADPLGRLFTTPQQRMQLEELRNAEGVSPVEIAEFELLPEETAEVTEDTLGSIRVRGLVVRKQGRSTAWLNDSNTFEGDLSLEYVTVNPAHIGRNHVRILLPDQQTSVNVKVGETLDPESEQVTDLLTPSSPPARGSENSARDR